MKIDREKQEKSFQNNSPLFEKNELINEIHSLKKENNELKEKLIAVEDILQKTQSQLNWLTEQVKLANVKRFGKSSETTNTLQLPLFDDEPIQEDNPDVEESVETITYERRKKSTGRLVDASKLPREIIRHDLPEHEKICACGNHLIFIREDKSEQLDYIPAQIKVIEHIHPQYACRACDTVKSAEKPMTSPLPKSMASSGLITEVILDKYEYHMPLYRQSQRFKQHGLVIPDNTLGHWVMNSAEVLAPLIDAFWFEVKKTAYLQTDETTVKILNPEQKGYMWVYHSAQENNRFVMFEFSLSRSGDIPEFRLMDFQGKFQSDGYSGYNDIRQKKNVIAFGCWDHARRKFAEVIKICAAQKEGIASRLLNRIGKLYLIEREIDALNSEQKSRLRLEKSKPIIEDIYSIAEKANAPPKSKLSVALTYLHNQKSLLTAYLEHGEIHISNCWVENLIRPFALGRKNWLFVGNEIAANKSALLYSLIQSCKLNSIHPRPYFIYLFQQVNAIRRHEIDPRLLLPHLIDKNLLGS